MTIASHFLFGFLAGFIGVIPPGLLNMTAAKLCVNQGKAKSLLFSLGASLIVIAQVSIAVLTSKYLNKHPEVIEFLEKVAVGIFFILSIYFFFKARAEHKSANEIKIKNKKSVFGLGLFLSSINIFPIPFYVAYSTFLSARSLFTFEMMTVSTFVASAAIGTFLALWLYTFLIRKLKERGEAFANNINYFLAVITMFVAVFTIIRIYNR
ncbi:lysine transporter LysE [Spongiivirga sp. MCCC 1A20706]|uniref:LysE family translocator n=1 Tax=Spongiivirga sp. MCCC 1A20706 TaxID=3160963 RepID=UPI003977662B